MTYTETQMRITTEKFLALEANRQLIHDLQSAWRLRHDDARRYQKVYEDENLTLWLLGWRPGVDTQEHHADITPIHGHMNSAVLVTCLQGEVDNDDYGIVAQDPNVAVGTTVRARFEAKALGSGHSIYVPVGGVHDMHCDEKDGRGFALTLHAYSPKLATMTYYEEVDRVDGDPILRYTGLWNDPGQQRLSPYATPMTPPFGPGKVFG